MGGKKRNSNTNKKEVSNTDESSNDKVVTESEESKNVVAEINKQTTEAEDAVVVHVEEPATLSSTADIITAADPSTTTSNNGSTEEDNGEEEVKDTATAVATTVSSGNDNATNESKAEPHPSADADADSAANGNNNNNNNNTPTQKSAAQKTVDAAVAAAKDVATATVDQIKAQLGEEKTQKAVEYATYAKAEVMEVVDFAREAVEGRAAGAKAAANEKIDEVKEKINEVKEMATEKVNEARGKITEAKEKATETVTYVKNVASEKTEKPHTWLKGEVAETPLEHTACDIATVLIATSLSVSSAALGVVGLDKKAASAVTAVRSRAADIATHTTAIQSVHGFASGYWPYQLATRMVGKVDGCVKERIAGGGERATKASTESS